MKQRGFTLIEVIIALFVIALGISALLVTLTNSAENVGHLRNKSFAQWIALNRISELRLGTTKPTLSTSTGSIEYAGTRWCWEQQISDPGQADILRVDVRVALTCDQQNQARDTPVENFPAIATAYGFIGQAQAPPSGIEPDWSMSAPASGGGTKP
jgi:general secretion pathway protein I